MIIHDKDGYGEMEDRNEKFLAAGAYVYVQIHCPG